MGEIRKFSKVGEVVAVKEIKLNNLTNLQSASVFMFLMFETYSQVCIRETREYMDSRLVTTETRDWCASCIEG